MRAMWHGRGAIPPPFLSASFRRPSRRPPPPASPSLPRGGFVLFTPRRGVSSGASGSSGPPQGGAAATPPVASAPRRIQIAIVGSGPSGCFVATALTRRAREARVGLHVDVWERLPVPAGLVRYGVAPDHPEVKRVQRAFLDLFRGDAVTWVGNVDVGRRIPLAAMLRHYAAVVLATGAGGSRALGIPGETLPGVSPVRAFVEFYNTLPFPYGTPRGCPIALARTRRVVVIGNGNVALDAVRVLAGPPGRLAATDINAVAARALAGKRIESIDVIARRGVDASAFTIAPFRELLGLPSEAARVVVDAFALDAAIAAGEKRGGNPRAHRRLMELLKSVSLPAEQHAAELRAMATTRPPSSSSSSSVSATTDEATNARAGEGRSGRANPPEGVRETALTTRGGPLPPCAVRFRYHLKPIRILAGAGGRVSGVLFERTDADVSDPDARYVVVPCDLVLTSVGYLAEGFPGVPFDPKMGVIPNENGRVRGMPRVYCSGWVKTGPKGVILHTIADAQETAAAVMEDLQANRLPTVGIDDDDDNNNNNKNGENPSETLSPAAESIPSTTTMFGKYGLIDYFVEKQMEPVSIAGVERILHVEKERGVDLGKLAEKVDSVRDMLDIAHGGEIGSTANDRVRGIAPARPEPLLYLKELLDDHTDLAPLAKTLAREVPGKMAEGHHPGRISPFQL